MSGRPQKSQGPRADRPNIPYGLRAPDEGLGLLPWSRVSERMRNAYVYWVATATPDNRPHVIPVWGVCIDDIFYFSNGTNTRTGRNLAANASVVVHLESGEDVVIIEGVVEPVADAALIGRINDAYAPKYLWRERMEEGWYALRPETAFAWLCPSIGLGAESVYAGARRAGGSATPDVAGTRCSPARRTTRAAKRAAAIEHPHAPRSPLARPCGAATAPGRRAAPYIVFDSRRAGIESRAGPLVTSSPTGAPACAGLPRRYGQRPSGAAPRGAGGRQAVDEAPAFFIASMPSFVVIRRGPDRFQRAAGGRRDRNAAALTLSACRGMATTSVPPNAGIR
jgi:hypothetical protein